MDQIEFDMALDEIAIVAKAKNRYESTSAHHGALNNLYDTYMTYYDPPNGDQWPDDRNDPERADKIHMSVNFVKPVVDIESRLQSILPRISLTPTNPDNEDERSLAEAVEKLHLSWLTDSKWDIWLGDTAKTRAVFGKTAWKPFWNEDDKHPDVVCLERISNLRIGWSGSDYRKKDWAIFEYTLSPWEAMDRFDITVLPTPKNEPLAVIRNSDHTDPLDTIPNYGMVGRPSPKYNATGGDIQPAEYEQKQVTVWDYWYKKPKKRGKGFLVCNAIIIENVIVESSEHPEYLDIPYIIIENDHRPGSPEGISSVKAIMDLQDQYNLSLSLWAQVVYDNVDLAYQLTGDNASDVEAGMVPRRGQIMPTGMGNRVEAIPTSQNQFPVQQLTVEYWTAMFRVSGFPEIMFGGVPGAQISGRALATQIEAVANRLDPKRRRLYQGLLELFRFWKFMVTAKRGSVNIMDEEGNPQEMLLSKALDNAGTWKIVAPELTPRDVVEVTQNAINQMQAKMLNLTGAMDMVGIDSPEQMVRAIIRERNNIDLYPGEVQIKAAVMATLQQMQMAQQQMAAAAGETEGAVAGMQGAAAENTLREMGNRPTGDEEAGGVASTAGEPGTASLGGTAQTLIRPDQETGQAEALQQIGLRRDI